MRPASIAELVEAVRHTDTVRITGAGTKAAWRVPTSPLSADLDSSELAGIVDFSPNDQVVCVRAGTPLNEIQAELGKVGQCLPMLSWHSPYSHLDLEGTVAGSLSINLPNILEGECGSWRDWVLGMTLVLADGTVAKSGSHAVKSVAGYDIHKLMIGARGSLAVIAEVILRTYPVKSLPAPKIVVKGEALGPCGWVQRVKPSDFAMASQNAAGINVPSSSTIFRFLPPEESLPRFHGDWVLRSNCGQDNLRLTDAAAIHYMKRTKAIFDPGDKLNPGEMGVL